MELSPCSKRYQDSVKRFERTRHAQADEVSANLFEWGSG
jgi:hypothetical protein